MRCLYQDKTTRYTYILQGCHTLAHSVRVFGEFRGRSLQDTLGLLVLFVRWRVDDSHAVLTFLTLAVIDHLSHETGVHGRIEHTGATSELLLLPVVRRCR